jgi:hypothetical protein
MNIIDQRKLFLKDTADLLKVLALSDRTIQGESKRDNGVNNSISWQD